MQNFQNSKCRTTIKPPSHTYNQVLLSSHHISPKSAIIRWNSLHHMMCTYSYYSTGFPTDNITCTLYVTNDIA